MSKYIDAEKLIKSINNYQEGAKAALNPIDGDADYYKGKIDACKDMKDFITALQQEQPASKEVEKEIEHYIQECDIIDDETGLQILTRGEYKPLEFIDLRLLAYHFAEWGVKHLRDSTKMIPEEKLPSFDEAQGTPIIK